MQWNCGLLGFFYHTRELKRDICLRGELPEAIRPGVEYRLSGVTEHGPFTGQTVVPQPPVLLEPESDTVRFQAEELLLNQEPWGLWVPVRYRFGADVGTRIGEMGGATTPFRTTVLTGPGSGRVRFDPDTFGRSGRDSETVPVPMRLAGIGWNYTRFAESGDLLDFEPQYLVLRPWPETGIEGEGVYGYFDGVSFSRTVTVVVEFPERDADGPDP